MNKAFVEKNEVLMLTTVGLLIGLAVVFRGLLGIMVTDAFRLSFEFLPIAIVAIKFGPWKAGTAAMIADLVAFWIFPRGTFFPGFTFTAFLMGAAYGLFLRKNPTKIINITLAAIIVVVFIQLGLESLWLSIISGVPYPAMVAGRILRTVIMLPLQIVFIKFAAEAAKRIKLI